MRFSGRLRVIRRSPALGPKRRRTPSSIAGKVHAGVGARGWNSSQAAVSWPTFAALSGRLGAAKSGQSVPAAADRVEGCYSVSVIPLDSRNRPAVWITGIENHRLLLELD
jgi:hypothetical protein